MNAIQSHRVQADLVTERTHSLRISYTWILLIFSYRWWFGFVESCLNCTGEKQQKLMVCGFLFKARKFTWWGWGLSWQLMLCFISLTQIDKWAGGGFAGSWRPTQARCCQLSNVAQWLALPGSYSRWGRNLSSDRLLRNNDVNSSLRMWEQCLNPAKGAISVIRKPEKLGA